MSLFGQPERKTGTLFGSTTGPSGGLFAQSQGAQQNTGGLFAQAQPAQQNAGGLFAQSQAPQQNAGGLFAQPQNPQQNTGGLFGRLQQPQNTGGGLFNQSQQQQQQQQQQPNLNNSLFGGFVQPAPELNQSQRQQLLQQQQGLPQLRKSVNDRFAGASLNGTREKSVFEQMKIVHDRWDKYSPDCAFQRYFYNAVKPEEAPFYGPSSNEDHRKWEEALVNKPSEGSIPVLARGFDEMAARIQYQAMAVNALRHRIHEINRSLTIMKDQHELEFAPKITKAKQKHIEHTQRTLQLATKVQILRNRGYVMDQAEEELKKKLIGLEKLAFDPLLGGRQEEIWARMSGVRERAQILQQETEKLSNGIDSQQKAEFLSEDDQKQLEKILKGYDQQLEHLKKMLDDTTKEYTELENDQPQPARPAVGRR